MTNDLITAPQNDLPETSQLVTLNPQTYVGQVFASFKKKLTKAKKDAVGVTFDITTTAGMTTAKGMRAMFKDIRLTAEAERKARKAPILEIGKLLDSKYKELAEEIEPLEGKFDAVIKAEEQRKADEKAEKERIERVRVEAIENRIALLRNAPMRYTSSNSAAIVEAIREHTALELVPDEYDEYLEDAINAVNATLVELGKLCGQAVEREEAAAKAEAERAELERLRTENEAREKREAEELRQRETDEKARADAAAAEAKLKDDELAQLRAQLAAMQAPKVEPVPEVVAEPEPAPEPAPAIVMHSPAVTIMSDAPPCANFAAPRKMARPSDADIVDAVAAHFNVSSEHVVEWLVDMDFAALTAAGA